MSWTQSDGSSYFLGIETNNPLNFVLSLTLADCHSSYAGYRTHCFGFWVLSAGRNDAYMNTLVRFLSVVARIVEHTCYIFWALSTEYQPTSLILRTQFSLRWTQWIDFKHFGSILEHFDVDRTRYVCSIFEHFRSNSWTHTHGSITYWQHLCSKQQRPGKMREYTHRPTSHTHKTTSKPETSAILLIVLVT